MNMLSYFSKKIHLDPMICALLLKSAPYRYKEFHISKRNGKKRLIAQPTPAIKALQVIATQEYLNKFPVHPSATAYRKRMGIKNNAQRHVNNQYILKLDFVNFFHSIVPSDFDRLDFNNVCNLSNEEVNLLRQLFFWKPKHRSKSMCLSIGAPSSPQLSNILMYNIDLNIFNFCTSYGATYTRYSDDITISSDEPNILNTILNEVKLVCRNSESPNLKFNRSKTVFSSKKNNRTITGIVITNDDTISLGRERRRKIRSMIHHVVINSRTDLDFITRLNGHISFAHDIEPDFIGRLERTYLPYKNLLIGRGIRLFKSCK